MSEPKDPKSNASEEGPGSPEQMVSLNYSQLAGFPFHLLTSADVRSILESADGGLSLIAVAGEMETAAALAKTARAIKSLIARPISLNSCANASRSSGSSSVSLKASASPTSRFNGFATNQSSSGEHHARQQLFDCGADSRTVLLSPAARVHSGCRQSACFVGCVLASTTRPGIARRHRGDGGRFGGDFARLDLRGYLTQLDHESERRIVLRIAAAVHEADLARHLATFVIVPTYLCNLRCPYCFQPHQMHARQGEFDEVLTRQRADEVFAVIDQFSKPGAVARALGVIDAQDGAPPEQNRERAITLFGGEPLLERTVDVVSYIVEQASHRNIPTMAISNGVELQRFRHLLGSGRLEWLQITLDGPGHIHDKRRIGPEHRQTFDRIAANIELALARQCSRRTAHQRQFRERRPSREFFTRRLSSAAGNSTRTSRPTRQRYKVHGFAKPTGT